MSNWLQSILLNKHSCRQLAFLLRQMVLHFTQAPMMGACRVQVLLCSLYFSATSAIQLTYSSVEQPELLAVTSNVQEDSVAVCF